MRSISKLCGVVVVALLAQQPLAWAQSNAQWSGPYIGGTAGYTMLDMDISRNGMNYPTLSFDGGSLGLLAGYNFQIQDQFVIGAEADFAWANLDGWQGNHVWGSEWSGSIKGRLGYLVTPGIMLFGSLGAGYSELQYVGGPPIPPPGPAPPPLPQEFIDELVWGYSLGAGFEAYLNDVIRVRFEYLFTDFGDWTFVATDGDSFEVDAESQVIRFGVVVPIGG